MGERVVRKHAKWMAKPDDRILEYCSRHGPQRPLELRDGLRTVARDLNLPLVYVEKRCEILSDYGLLEHDFRSRRYEATSFAEEYLDGVLDAGRLKNGGPTRYR